MVTTINAEQFRETVFFSLGLHRFGNRALVRNMESLAAYLALRINGGTGAVESTGNRTAGNTKTTKQLLRSAKLDAIVEFQTSVKERLCGRFGKAMPSRIKEGLFVVSKSLITEFEDELKAAQAKLSGLVEEFVNDDYQQAIARAQTNDVNDKDNPGLGPLFNAKDYPTPGKLAETFSIEWQWLALGVPEDLPAALRAEQAEKLEKKFSAAADEIQAALYEQLQSFLDHLVDKLTPAEDGKPKIFRDSLVENVRDFCAAFDARNFLRDGNLENLVNKARAVLDGVSADKIRKADDIKTQVREKFTAIKNELDQAITTLPGRKFDLED